MKARDRKKIRIIGKILFVLYIVFIIYFLLISEWYGRVGVLEEYRYNLELFREIRRFWDARGVIGWIPFYMNVFGNVFIFLPFGFFMPMSSRHRSFFSAFFYSFGLSLCVETFQLLSLVGSFDVDDILLNTIGGILGYGIYIICCAIRRRHVEHKNQEKN